MRRSKIQIFHPGAYLDGINKLKSPVIASLMCVLLLEYVYVKINVFHYFETFHTMALPVFVVFTFNPAIYLWYLLREQSSRIGSDCIHALPIKKRAMACSYFLSVMTADVFFFWMGCVMATIVVFTSGVSFSYDYPISICLLFSMPGAIFVAAVMLVALSLTGTGFSVNFMFLFLLIAPRFVLTILECHMDPRYGFKGTILDGGLNMVTCVMYSVLFEMISKSSHYREIEFVTEAQLSYTTVIGVLFLILALYLFGKRPSEAAGNRMISKHGAEVFRFLIEVVAFEFLFFAIVNTGLALWMIWIILVLGFIIFLLIGVMRTGSIHSDVRRIRSYICAFLTSLLLYAVIWAL